MKTKKLSRKLKLNKKTVSNLSGSDMGDVHGGGTYVRCPTGMTYCYSDCVTGCPLCPSEYCTTENTFDQNTCAVSCDQVVCSYIETCTC